MPEFLARFPDSDSRADSKGPNRDIPRSFQPENLRARPAARSGYTGFRARNDTTCQF